MAPLGLVRRPEDADGDVTTHGDVATAVMEKRWQVWALGQRAPGCLLESRESLLRENQDNPAGVPSASMSKLPHAASFIL